MSPDETPGRVQEQAPGARAVGADLQFEIRRRISLADPQLLARSAWPDEDERWHELAFLVLAQSGGPDPATARPTAELLGSLDLLDLPSLARLVATPEREWEHDPHARHLIDTLLGAGWTATAAMLAAGRLAAMASHIRDGLGGSLAAFLRRHGETMLDELVAAMPVDGLTAQECRLLYEYWLQNAAAMPVLARSEELATWLRRTGATEASMVAAADALDLNVAVLDDLARSITWE